MADLDYGGNKQQKRAIKTQRKTSIVMIFYIGI